MAGLGSVLSCGGKGAAPPPNILLAISDDISWLHTSAAMTGRSLLPMLEAGKQGRVDESRNRVFTAMERHAWCREEGVGYPMRAIRTCDYLYIRNFESDRWPAGYPQGYGFGEIDDSPTKAFILEHRDSPEYGGFFELACAKRPAEELYDIAKDPGQLTNVAAEPAYAEVRTAMWQQLERYLRQPGGTVRPVTRPSQHVNLDFRSFLCQAESWNKARRLVAKVGFHAGESFPRVGFIVTNLETDSGAVVRFYNKRGTADRSAAGAPSGPGGLAEPQIGGDPVMKQAGEGKVREESAEKRAVSSFGFYRKG